MTRRALAALLAAALSALATGGPAGAAIPGPVAPPEHRRSPDQTFLTFPEWSLVFGPAEYAEFLREKPPSEFPFFAQIRQFWQGYGAVWRRTRGRYPFNLGYHVMVLFIGTSTTFEYSVRAAYETLIGRLSELTRTHGPTPEDRFAAQMAQRYVDFIRIWPWYEYDFWGETRSLWRTTGLWGPDPIRKWERKYALTAEYGAKALYGWLTKKATKTAYERPSPVTAILLDRLPGEVTARLPQLRVLKRLPDGSVLVTVPRYDAFNRHASVLAEEGVTFLEIAGNRDLILVAVLAPTSWRPDDSRDHVVLTQVLTTRPSVRRVVLEVPVSSLARSLTEFERRNIPVEHVYDY